MASCLACGRELSGAASYCAACDQPPGAATETTEIAAWPQPGRAAGRYELRRTIGRGGSKEVYLAWDAELEREVALSLVSVHGQSPAARERVRREARLMARLGEHPHVVMIHDAGEEERVPYLVAQWMAGGSVADLLATRPERRLPVSTAARIAAEVAEALAYSHANGVVHRDVKPDNIWLTASGTAALGDFGIAWTRDQTPLTVPGSLIGTVRYMAPEQARGVHGDPRSDLYALGVTLYEMLCGRPPFLAADATTLLELHASEAPVPPSQHRPDLPPGLERVVLGLLAKVPGERPPTGEAVRIALAATGVVAGAPQAGLRAGPHRALIGREPMLARLTAAFAEAAAGRGRIVALAGEPGIGKTAVAEALSTHAREHGAAVAWGRCTDDPDAPPYWPWAQALDGLDVEPALAAELAGAAAPVRMFALTGAVRRALRAATSSRPLLFVLDDVHAAAPEALRLLRHSAPELAALPVLLVITLRDGGSSRSPEHVAALAELAREPHWERHELAALGRGEVAEAIEAVAGVAPSAEVAAELHERSGGNPFLVVELARHAVAHGASRTVPAAIRDAVARRVSTLPPATVELLTCAAVLGGAFEPATLARAGGLPEAEVLQRLEPAVAAELIGGSERLRFAQPVVRDAVVENLTAAERARIAEAARRPAPPAPEPSRGIPLPKVLARPTRRPAVGRAHELERLSAVWAQARAGNTRLTTVTGEPGMGKTHTAGRLATAAHAQDSAVVLYGRCDEEAVVAYQPFTEALRYYAAHTPALVADPGFGDELSVLRGLVPELRHGAAEPAGAGEAGVLDRHRFFEAFATVLAQAAARSPLLLVLDDLHWADQSTLLLLRHVRRHLEDLPAMMLLTYRPADAAARGDLEPLLAALEREGPVDRVALDGLDTDSASRLAAGFDGRATPGFLRRLRAMTGGNPFFIEEVLRGVGEQHAGVAPLSARVLEELDVPAGVSAVIGGRLQHVSASALEVLSCAAVAGPRIDFALLSELFGADAVRAAVAEAADAHLVAHAGDRREGLAFAHALIRGTLTARLSDGARMQLHHRIAVALERAPGGRAPAVAELARHFFEARDLGDAEKAVAYGGEAAEQATAALAHEEAAGHYRNALHALDALPEDLSRGTELLLRLAEATERATQIEESRSSFEQAARIARGTGETAQLARAALGFAKWRRDETPDPVAIGLVEEALGRVGTAETATRARLLSSLARHLVEPTQRDRRRQLIAEAIELARRSGPETLSVVLSEAPTVLAGPESVEQRLAVATEGLALAGAVRQREAYAFAHAHRVLALFELGRGDDADRCLEAYDGAARELHRPWFTWHVHVLTAMRRVLVGAFEDSREPATQARLLGRTYDPGSAETETFYDVMVAKARGRTADRRGAADTAAAYAEKHRTRAIWSATHAALLASLGERAGALEIVQGVADDGLHTLPRDNEWLTTTVMLAEAAATLGCADLADQLYSLLLPFAGRHAVTERGAACWGSLSRHLALLATTAGHHDLADRHFEAALGENRRLGATPWTVHTAIAYADALMRRGPVERRRARSLAALAETTATRLGIELPGRS